VGSGAWCCNWKGLDGTAVIGCMGDAVGGVWGTSGYNELFLFATVGGTVDTSRLRS